MNFEEHAAKSLLAEAGIAIPKGQVCLTPDEAAKAVVAIGPSVVKAQVPAGKRGKAGGIVAAATAGDAYAAAQGILGMDIAGFTVERLLVEEQANIAREFYAAVLNDADSKGPLLLFSVEGGMEIEDIAAEHPDKLLRLPVDIRRGLDSNSLAAALEPLGLGELTGLVNDFFMKLYRVYRDNDAELVEINPLALSREGGLIALDCKFILDDSGAARRPELAARAAPEKRTRLETKSREYGLNYIELDGEVGILANGAGLTMTTMDAVSHYGGRPANFLEIGGEAYTLGKPALEIVLANPRVKSLVINFCGAFARTDVMTAGILEAWEKLKPDVPVFFSINGTGEDAAIAAVRERLQLEPFRVMDDAVKTAVEAAR